MTVTVTPTLTLDGAPVAYADPAALVLAIDKLAMTWGRSTVLESPTPSTLSLRLLDRSPTASTARRTDLIGRFVQFGWRSSTAVTGALFGGRVTDVNVTRRKAGGFHVALAVSSRQVELASLAAPEGTSWPAETFRARLARIVALLPANMFAGGIVTPTRADVGLTDVADPSLDLLDYPAAPADVGGSNVLQLLTEFYRSLSPLPLVYDPNTDRLTFAGRRLFTPAPGVPGPYIGRLVTSPAAGGRYVARTTSSAGVSLDARRLRYDGPVGQPLDSRLTRIDVKYKTAAGVEGTVPMVLDAAAETLLGRRALALDTIHSDFAYANQLGGLYANLIYGEASRPRLDTFTYAGAEFPDDVTAAALLTGAEGQATAFVAGSWLTRLGVRPVFGLIGGRVEYAGGSWSLAVQSAPVGFTGTPTPLTVRYAGTPAVTLAQIDPSVTFGDLAYIEVGAGFTTSTQPPWGTP